MRIVALAGGVGASKLLLGLAQVMNGRDLTAIVNTGDDLSLHGLEISPDLDIVTYTLAGVVNPATGWGYRDETFHLLERLAVYGGPRWFHLGDRDLATHIYRTGELRKGRTLSQVADSIRQVTTLETFSQFVGECFNPDGSFVEDISVYPKIPGKAKKHCKYCPHKKVNCDAKSDIPESELE